jgi:hypothetical protein
VIYAKNANKDQWLLIIEKIIKCFIDLPATIAQENEQTESQSGCLQDIKKRIFAISVDILANIKNNLICSTLTEM